MTIEENAHDEGTSVLSFALLRKGIAEQRFAEAWALYTKYGIVHGPVPNVPLEANISYPEVLAAHFPEEFRKDARACPEGYAIQVEVQKDMDALEAIVRGEYQFSRSSKLHIRDYTIATDNGTVDCAQLALAGILPDEAYAALQGKDFRSLVKDSYGVDPLRVAFGFGMRLIERHFDAQTYTLFGKYKVEQGKRRDQLCNIPGDIAAQMLKDASSVILVTELAEHIARVYNAELNSVKGRVADVCHAAQDWIQKDDPYHAFPYSFPELFGTNVHGAATLPSVNALIHVFQRDERIVKTHCNMIETAERISTDRNAIKEWLLLGKMSYRNLSLLPTLSGLKTHFICEYDLREKKALKEAGIEYLTFCEANDLEAQKVESYRKFRRENTGKELTENASGEYLHFCEQRELDPKDKDAFVLFKKRKENRMKNERIHAFYREGIDWSWHRKRYWELEKEELAKPEVYDAIYAQNRERIAAKYEEESWKRGNPLAHFVEEGIFYVPLVSPMVPEEWTSSWSAKEVLKRRKIARTILGEEYISLKDAIELWQITKAVQRARGRAEEEKGVTIEERVNAISIAVPQAVERGRERNTPEAAYKRDLAKYRPLTQEERATLSTVTHGDAGVGLFIPIEGGNGLYEIAEKFLQEQIRANSSGELAKEYNQYQQYLWLTALPSKEIEILVPYMLQELFYKHNLMPKYLALLREELEARRKQERDYEKKVYRKPGFIAVYEALRIAQGKERNKAKGHVWEGPTSFSTELSALVELHRPLIARAYQRYSAAAERAKELLYLGNLRLVPRVAERYEHPDLSFLDKVQEGNIGLQRGVEMYDYRIGKFSTHAFQWIRQGVQRAYVNAGPVRLPAHVHETVSLVNRVQKAKREQGEDARLENAINWISKGEVKSPTTRVEMAVSRYRKGKGVLRLDGPASNEDETHLHERIGDETTMPEMLCEARDKRRRIEKALEKLTREQRLVLELRYNLHPEYEEGLTQEEVGAVMSHSKTAISTLEREALNALRREHGEDLRIFM